MTGWPDSDPIVTTLPHCRLPGQSCSHRVVVGVDSLGHPRRRTPPICRVLARTTTGANGCWIWGGAKAFGYGQVNLGLHEGRALTHRVVFVQLIGPVPDGLELDHLCRVPACCNPAHLEPVTHAVNVERGTANEASTAYFTSRDSCRNGHEYTPENTRITPLGRRRCRTCVRDWSSRNKGPGGRRGNPLSADERQAVLEAARTARTQLDVANEFGITQSAVSQIVRRARALEAVAW